MGLEFRSPVVCVLFAAATLTFLGCVALSIVRWRFSLRTLLIATTAACISLAAWVAR